MKARGERLAERVSRGLRNEGIHAAYGLPGGPTTSTSSTPVDAAAVRGDSSEGRAAASALGGFCGAAGGLFSPCESAPAMRSRAAARNCNTSRRSALETRSTPIIPDGELGRVLVGTTPGLAAQYRALRALRKAGGYANAWLSTGLVGIAVIRTRSCRHPGAPIPPLPPEPRRRGYRHSASFATRRALPCIRPKRSRSREGAPVATGRLPGCGVRS